MNLLNEMEQIEGRAALFCPLAVFLLWINKAFQSPGLHATFIHFTGMHTVTWKEKLHLDLLSKFTKEATEGE